MAGSFTTERNKIIKKVLSEKYGRKNVVVRAGKGTASSWVEIGVTTPKPACENIKTNGHCSVCREMERDLVKEIEDISRKELAKHGMKFSTYISDDGYDSERECTRTDVFFV